MSNQTPTFAPSAEEILIMIDGLDTLAQVLEDSLEEKLDAIERDGETLEASIEVQMLTTYLGQVTLYRGRMEPFVEDLYNVGTENIPTSI